MAEAPADYPLSGLKVLDFSRVLAGPFAGRLLSDLGADVVKVEPPEGDVTRNWGRVKGGVPGFFHQQNAGKRNICIDLRAPGARELVLDLVRQADVLIENYRPDVMGRLGLGYDVLSEANPRLIMLSISGFGAGGPESRRPAYAPIVHAEMGLIARQARRNDVRRTDLPLSVADTNASLHGLIGLLSAVILRERTGRGQHIDIAMVDVMFHLSEVIAQYDLSGGTYRPTRMGQHHPLVCPVGIYRLPQGWCILMCLDRQWPYLVTAMGRPDLGTDPRFNPSAERAANQADLVPQIQDWLLSFPDNDSVLEVCRAHRIPIAPCLDPVDAIDHPHYVARQMVRRVPDPVVGEVLIPGYPFKFSAQPDLPDLVAPLLGEHNAEVLGQLLGLDPATVAELEARGVLLRTDR